MRWHPDELARAAALTAEISACTGPRRTRVIDPIVLRLSEAPAREEGVTMPLNPQKVAVRHLCRAMGLDECRLPGWRLEHKLVQALVLHRYCPGIVPVTRGLRQAVCDADANGRSAPAGEPDTLVKCALGESSREGRRPVYADAVRQEREACAGDGALTAPSALWDERLVVQERLAIHEEYRVHSLEDTVVADLTFLRHTPFATTRTGRRAANQFVQDVLNSLPAGLVKDALYGWDVAVDAGGRWHVVEANPAGIHRVFRPGFHCSGFLQIRAWGAPAIATLCAFVEAQYGIAVRVEIDVDEETPCSWTYWWIARCHELLGLAPHDAGVLMVGPDTQLRSPEQNFFAWALAHCRAMKGSEGWPTT